MQQGAFPDCDCTTLRDQLMLWQHYYLCRDWRSYNAAVLVQHQMGPFHVVETLPTDSDLELQQVGALGVPQPAHAIISPLETVSGHDQHYEHLPIAWHVQLQEPVIEPMSESGYNKVENMDSIWSTIADKIFITDMKSFALSDQTDLISESARPMFNQLWNEEKCSVNFSWITNIPCFRQICSTLHSPKDDEDYLYIGGCLGGSYPHDCTVESFMTGS